MDIELPKFQDFDNGNDYLRNEIHATINIVEKAFQSDNVFKIQNGHRWIINYDQLEKEVYNILSCTPSK